MRRIQTVIAVLCATAPALGADDSAAPATAESAAAQPRELARVRYMRGVEAFQENRFRDAIDLFLDADQLAPSAALSFNIAAAYEKIERSPAALRWYRDYLRRAPEAPDRAEVMAKVEKLERLLEQTGVQQLTVLTTPPGAAVVIDGNPAGNSPWTGELPPGSHRLELTLAEHAPVMQSVELGSSHSMDVAVELRPVVSPRASPPSAPPGASRRPPADAGTGSRKTVRTLGWIGIAAGGAALGGALVFEGLRRGAESAAESERSQIGYADGLETVQDRQTIARVLLGTGAALAATGGLLVFFGREPSRSAEGVALTCGPAGCVSSVRGSF